jgi:hypothetical protein
MLRVRAVGARLAGLAAAAIGLAMAGLASRAALAQNPPAMEPAIIVASVITAEVAREAPLRIELSPADAAPRQSFLRIRGLPRTVALSDGHSIAAGVWAVPLSALPRLRLATPVSSEGKSELTISLVTIDGVVLSEAKSTLSIGPGASEPKELPLQPSARAASLVAPPLSAALAPPPAQAARRPLRIAPQLPPEDRERAVTFLQRGNALIAAKDVSAAQHFFKRAAEIGLPEAALALARTFDPVELARLGAVGVRPDRDAAQKWYERARELGSPEADTMLRRMSAQ